MKRKKYVKAMKVHQDIVEKFADELHELTNKMREEELSIAEVISLLETEKLFRFDEVSNEANARAFVDWLKELEDEEE